MSPRTCCSAQSNTSSPPRKVGQHRLTIQAHFAYEQKTSYPSGATNHTKRPSQLCRTSRGRSSRSSSGFLPLQPTAPGRGWRATPQPWRHRTWHQLGCRVVRRDAEGAGQGERGVLARLLSSRVQLPAPSRPLWGLHLSFRCRVLERRLSKGAAGGGLRGSAGAPGWSGRPGHTGRSHPYCGNDRGLGKPPSVRAGEGPPAAAASAEARREEPRLSLLARGPRRRDCPGNAAGGWRRLFAPPELRRGRSRARSPPPAASAAARSARGGAGGAGLLPAGTPSMGKRLAGASRRPAGPRRFGQAVPLVGLRREGPGSAPSRQYRTLPTAPPRAAFHLALVAEKLVGGLSGAFSCAPLLASSCSREKWGNGGGAPGPLSSPTAQLTLARTALPSPASSFPPHFWSDGGGRWKNLTK